MKTIILNFKHKIKDIIITEDTEILGLFIGNNNDISENQFNIVHNKANLVSRITIKAIISDKAIFRITPKLIINKGAKNTDSYLKIVILALSNDVKAQAIPALEILENDVKAGHAATISKLDREQLYYLQAHGLSKSQARKLLINAFTKDILAKIESVNHEL